MCFYYSTNGTTAKETSKAAAPTPPPETKPSTVITLFGKLLFKVCIYITDQM